MSYGFLRGGSHHRRIWPLIHPKPFPTLPGNCWPGNRTGWSWSPIPWIPRFCVNRYAKWTRTFPLPFPITAEPNACWKWAARAVEGAVLVVPYNPSIQTTRFQEFQEAFFLSLRPGSGVWGGEHVQCGPSDSGRPFGPGRRGRTSKKCCSPRGLLKAFKEKSNLPGSATWCIPCFPLIS